MYVSKAALRRVALPTSLALLALAGFSAVEASAAPSPKAGPQASAARTPFQLVNDRKVSDRLPQPEDRYALAGGCYTLEAAGQGYVTHDLSLDTAPAKAEPFHFQATRLGDYLIATNEGRDTSVPGATWDKRKYFSGAQVPVADTGVPVGAAPAPALPSVALPGVELASTPSDQGDWTLAAAGAKPDAKKQGQQYVLSLGARTQQLVATGGALGFADKGTPLTVRHVADDNPNDNDPNGTKCANWPEIDTNATGTPTKVPGGPAGPVQGLFEAHVHGMAYEFLGGKVRCGSPWNAYGVEYALPDCRTTGNVYNGALEVPLGGKSPSDPVTAYDPVGWPTFNYWPQHDTLTHEQYYWKWLERAYLGGLRLTTNLLVDNTALCTLFPVKKNSCNEMDGVRLQAKRMHELENYIDAQSGGPGEGWYRIVTTPAQARQVIHAGRLAVVMGIEVSQLFDCGEKLDVPQCTADDIDTRLTEAYDIGVRQMEVTNKFDNALSGVTGDGGTTGVLVNNGQKMVSGHYWDMLTCPPDKHTHEHDKTQLNAVDDKPGDGAGEIDALAGRVLSEFGGTGVSSIAAPAYGPGPHCNSRGLTKLGEHLIKAMISRGMIFDPDHMSALAQRTALDMIEHDVIPAEKAAAKKAHRPAVQPAVISSHSWGNDTIYQRIYGLDGMVAPRTDNASGFADTWATNVAWAKKNAPKGYVLGLGYGADTNGLGGQPGPRTKPKNPLRYTAAGWQAPIGGVTLHQQKSGVHSYDINRDGVAHYGLFADWFRELQLAADERHPELGGGKAIVRDMLHAPENYLELWERSTYGANSCVVDGALPQLEDINALIGGNFDGFLDAIGQPVSRENGAYRYCALDKDGHATVVDVPFNDDGKATGVRAAPVSADTLQGGDRSDGHVASGRAAALPATGGSLSLYACLLLLIAGSVSLALRRTRRS